jgi:hypothetical protein
MSTMKAEGSTVQSRPPRVSRPAVLLAVISSAAVIGAALAGYRFTTLSLLASMGGCAVILFLGFTGGRVERPVPGPLATEWTDVRVTAPRARDLAAMPPDSHSSAA